MTNVVETLDGFLTPTAAARRLGVSESTLRLWATLGRAPGVVITPGGRRLYRAADVERLAQERQDGSGIA